MVIFERVAAAVRNHGLHSVTREMQKQAGEYAPDYHDIHQAVYSVMLKMAENREAEKVIFGGLVSFAKVNARG